MDSSALNWFYKKLMLDNQCLLYNGSFSDDITYKIVGLSEATLKNYNESIKTQRRVSYLMAECFQNIIRHGNEKSENKKVNKHNSFFMTRYSLGKHYIVSANLINKQNIEQLKDKLDKLNLLGKEELKELYKHVIRYGQISDKGGAGLGLIEMARKSGHELGYSFIDYNNFDSLFYNQIVLKSEESKNDVEDNNTLGINSAIDFHSLLSRENILMIQKGDFSQDSILPVLNIIEKSILNKSSNSMKMKNIYKSMVELLQNISNHAYNDNEIKDGIFALSAKGENYMVSTGNCIHNTEVQALKNHLKKINHLNKHDLEDLYSSVLMDSLDNEDNNTGLGLINLAQIKLSDFEFYFEKLDNQKTFFTISVLI